MSLIPVLERNIRQGDSSQTQSHSEILGGRIAISDWGQSKSQWLAVLLFRSSDWTPIFLPEFLLIVLQKVPQMTLVWAEFKNHELPGDWLVLNDLRASPKCSAPCTWSWHLHIWRRIKVSQHSELPGPDEWLRQQYIFLMWLGALPIARSKRNSFLNQYRGFLKMAS